MLTVLKSPPIVALTGNPVRFHLQSDNFLEQSGAKIFFELAFTSGGTGFKDDWIELRWNGKVVRFVCKPNPDSSGTEVFDNSEYDVLDDWLARFTKSISLNYYLSSDFTISCESQSVILQARELGNQYAIEWDCSWTSANKPLAGMSGRGQIARPFFKVGMQVLLLSGDTWMTIGEDLLPVNDLGVTTFDIHRLFDDRVYSLFRYPESTQPLMLIRPNACREYHVRYYEQYGGELTAQQVTESGSFFILSGGISRIQEALYNRTNTSLWEKLTYNNYFLTWQPREKWITRYQTEKLFFLLQHEIPLLVLRIAFFFKDGTGNHSYPMGSIENPTPKKVYELTVTPSVMQVPGWETDQLDYYQVWLEDETMIRISEIRTYRIDYTFREHVRLFLFQNSLGGFDTIPITGQMEDYLEYDRAPVHCVPGSDYSEMNHRLNNFSVTESRVFKANTGWITPEGAAWIRDFFLSKQVFELINGKPVPVVITTTQALHRKDGEELFSIDFEYRQSFSTDHYTWEAVAADLSDDFNEDFANR